MPWNKDFECLPVEKLQKFQLEKLKETVGQYRRQPLAQCYKEYLEARYARYEKGLETINMASRIQFNKVLCSGTSNFFLRSMRYWSTPGIQQKGI